MRYRLMATYRGVPYEAGIGPTDGDVVLFAACPPPEELGFEPATGHWRKQLRIQDVQGLWQSRPMGTFRGDRCIVLDDLGDRLHIAYLGHDAYQAEQLGYWQVDRGVFELVTPRDEVTEIIEERLDYPRRATGRDPVAGEAGVAVGLLPAQFATAVPPPVSPQPVSPQPVSPQPVSPQPVSPQPVSPQPVSPQPVSPQPVSPQPVSPQPVSPQPVSPQPVSPQPVSPQAGYTPAAARDGRAQVAPPRDVPGIMSSRGVSAADTQRDLAVIPPTSEPPLPLEAAALRAASARTLGQPQPLARPPQAPPPQSQPAQSQPAQALQDQALQDQPARPGPTSLRRRHSALRRLATQRIFSELASLAAIPPSAYAIGEEVDGAMCLIQTPEGFEVFNAAAGSRHEVRLFDDEESAYFYLFGVLAAEAVRTGRLAPKD